MVLLLTSAEEGWSYPITEELYHACAQFIDGRCTQCDIFRHHEKDVGDDGTVQSRGEGLS